jgi:hypothetical protein
MTSIRKLLYAGLLAFTALNFVPATAAQSTAHGKFTLPHDVHWQNALVPAGDYRFSLEGGGPISVLTLTKMSGARTGFLFLVNDVEDANASDASKLVLESTASGSYVSAMQLPQFGMTLHFLVPVEAEEKQIPKAATLASAGAR